MPIAVSMAVCSNITAIAFLISALLYSFLYVRNNKKVPMQVYLAFLIINQAASVNGLETALIGIAICLILFGISAFFKDKLKELISPAVTSAVMLSTAFSMTALQTTNYFGIGATGNTVVEIFKNYRSLGFHPNWRGILYGTIVMVIMITFPRKFKKLSMIIKAPFIALLFVMLLNIVLIPKNMISPIAEAGKISFNGFNIFEISNINILYSVLCGFSLFACLFTLLNSKNEAIETSSTASVLSKRLVGILPLAVCIPLSIPFARTPVAACAVVFIVGGWQSVKWGEFKKAFISPISIIAFVLSIAATVLTDFSTGITLSALISILNSITAKRTAK